MQGWRQGVIAEIDHHPPDDAAVTSDDEPQAPTSMEESQPMAAGVLIYAELATAGDRA
jgi:hypothetical protein